MVYHGEILVSAVIYLNLEIKATNGATGGENYSFIKDRYFEDIGLDSLLEGFQKLTCCIKCLKRRMPQNNIVFRRM